MRRKRPAARIVPVDRAGRVLLLNMIDPGDPSKPPWWEIPGGGMDPGETTDVAAARELVEETGIRDFELGPVVWTQECTFTFAGMFFDSEEWIHVAWCNETVVEPQGLEFFEALAYRGYHWWDVDELLESDAAVLPPRLREFIAPVARGELPPSPIDIS